MWFALKAKTVRPKLTSTTLITLNERQISAQAEAECPVYWELRADLVIIREELVNWWHMKVALTVLYVLTAEHRFGLYCECPIGANDQSTGLLAFGSQSCVESLVTSLSLVRLWRCGQC